METLAFQPDAERFYADGYWRADDLWTTFAGRAEATPDKVAVRVGADAISYGELQHAAAAMSARLAAQGIAPGDVVLLLGRHTLEGVIALLACLHRGAVAAPLPPMFGRAQLAALAAQADAKALVGFEAAAIAKCETLRGEIPLVLGLTPADVAELRGGAVQPREPLSGDDLAVLLHSSGTTSAPKGIMHSSNTLRYAAEEICRRWELTAEDRHLVVCEFGFVGSLVFGYLAALLSGATAVLQQRWDADAALALIEEHRCTYTLYMPTHGADILRAGRETTRDCSSLRALSAPGLSREQRIEMHEVFDRRPLADYGLSEVPGHALHGMNEPWEKMVRTEGLPLPGTDLRIVDRAGERVAAGELGDVVVNGPSRFLGFFGNDELTRASLTEWGGYRTGDLGSLDEDGQFVYGGRSKDIIRRGGVTLVPAEIEVVIARHPAVREVAVVPLPDERLGERACAAMLLEPGSDAPSLAELQAFLDDEGLAKYTWPEAIEVFDEFPRTSSLKVVKRDIVKAILERTGARA